MPILKRRTQCADCPWRRRSRRGWLGEDDALSFFRKSVFGEQDMPCHMDINYDDPDWLNTQYPNAPYCAGGLIFFRNYMKMPRKAALAAAVRAVRPSRSIFSRGYEFLMHHDRSLTREEALRLERWPYREGDWDDEKEAQS